MKKQNCKCLICQTEEELTDSLESPASKQSFQEIVNSFPALAGFRSPLDVVDHLRRSGAGLGHAERADQVLRDLLEGYGTGLDQDVLPKLLLLGFFPALHRTFREISFGFDTLSSEDVAQEVLTAFLDVCRLRSIQTLKGHIAVTLYRTLRTTALRWAVKQTREVSGCEPLETLDEDALERLADGNSEMPRKLRDFLDDCRRISALSDGDYQLLVKVKLEGFKAKELAALDGGPSAMAIHQRIHRIMDRLRRRASR